MLEKQIRQYYQSFFANYIAHLMKRFCSPICITALAALTGLAIIPALIYQENLLALSLLIVSGLLDTLDGTVARMKNQTSQLGTACDILADRVVECSVIIGLYLYAPQKRGLACLLLLSLILICLISFLLNGMFNPNNSNKGFYYHAALVERTEAFIFFILMILCPQYFHVLCYTLSALIGITIIQHLINLKSACDANS